jgi:hypothetical protein
VAHFIHRVVLKEAAERDQRQLGVVHRSQVLASAEEEEEFSDRHTLMHARTREYLHVLKYVGTEDDEVLERERKRGDLGLDGSRQRVLLPALSRVLLFACLSCDSG